MSRRFDLIATDIDGTLLTSDGRVSERTAAALRAARANGTTLVLASGRPEAGLRHLAERHGIELEGLVLASCNGASVVDAASERVLTERYLDTAVVTRVHEVASEYGMTAMSSVGHTLHATDANGYYVQYEPQTNGMTLAVTDDFTTLDAHVHQVILSADPEHMGRARDAVVAAFDGIAEVTLSAPFYLQVTPHGANKGTGLADYAAYRGIDLARTIAFGDHENDIPMLRAAGVGVAMGNAVPHAKAAADHVTVTNDEDGIAVALAHFA